MKEFMILVWSTPTRSVYVHQKANSREEAIRLLEQRGLIIAEED